jgi:hypothetical protein
MTRTPVISSNLKSVGYENGILEIEFHSGGIYRYFHTNVELFNSLLSASSKGKFFDRNIKNKYSFQKLC